MYFCKYFFVSCSFLIRTYQIYTPIRSTNLLNLPVFTGFSTVFPMFLMKRCIFPKELVPLFISNTRLNELSFAIS
jgi:hypothetical protein